MCVVRLCSTQAASDLRTGKEGRKKEVEIRESVILTDNTVCEFSIRADRDRQFLAVKGKCEGSSRHSLCSSADMELETL